MKKAFATIAALVIFAGFSTLTFAQEQKAPEAPAAPAEAIGQKAPEQAAPAAEQKAEVKAETIVGVIASINAEAKTMVVKVTEGKKKVKKTIGVDGVDLTGLKAGKKVEVTLKADNPATAEKVELIAAPVKAKGKKGGKGK